MAIEKITKFSDAIQPADIINEVVDVVNNADLEEFVGASESQAGKKGIVPAPEAGSEDRYLNADGTWKEVKQNLTVYTSLEQIGITPGEETFASIHNALPVNSELKYYRAVSQTFADIYPEGTNYGYVKVTKLNSSLTKFEYIQYTATPNDEGSVATNDQLNIGIVWETYYNASIPTRPVVWNRHISSRAKDVQEINSPLSLNGLVNFIDHIIFSNKSNGQFGYIEVASSADVTAIPQGTYFFYGTAPTEDTDNTLRGTDFQGFSMRQSGQAFQLVVTGNNNMFWRADDNTSAESVPKYSAWIRLSSVNNSNHLVFNNGNELWIE